jgi:hypothetical protein
MFPQIQGQLKVRENTTTRLLPPFPGILAPSPPGFVCIAKAMGAVSTLVLPNPKP